jgi:nucleoside 2-deoxyribosyltransferase
MFLDHWDLALQPAAHEANLLIERLDYEHFTGDIVSEIRRRVSKCVAVVALLDEGNPNVFLEIGFAWGLGKPTILALHQDGNPPFDVRGHRILRYERIGVLKSIVARELAELAKQGIL